LVSRRAIDDDGFGGVNMSGAAIFDRHMLEVAFSEIDAVRRSLPDAALTALAEEVVQRVACNLTVALPTDLVPGEREIDALCAALLSDDQAAAATFIENAQRKGSSYQALCQSYLGAAAQRMGEWWENDQVSFYRVTIAAGRIYAILRVLRLERPTPTADLRRAAVFASVPGENHTLGITIATDLARDRGWDVELFVGLPHDELVHELEQRRPAIVGLSASGKRSMPALTRLIVALRISNPGARILVCGQIANSNLSLVGVTGADAAALDFQGAITQMERLLCGEPLRLV
jgi:MerR family transcriptional regulator, light-induced transcriptional regulator